jgi:hypothetical protein
MAFIRYQKYGNQEYAYEITPYWDKEKQRCRQKTKYLGVVVDKKNKIFEKRLLMKMSPEKLILDFGDSHLVNKVLRKSGYVDLIENVFGSDPDTLLALVTYRLCCHNASAMRHAQAWLDGNYARLLYGNAEVSSQRISDFLKAMGEEETQRRFFKEYFPRFSNNAKSGIIIDATSLPNQIHNPMTAWGRSGEEIDMQVRFLLVVDKETSSPLFFRCLPGNIVDVSALSNTVAELGKFGVSETYIYMDAGFFSEENITELYGNGLNFLTRLPAGRTLFKELIRKETRDDLESRQHMVRYGKRGLFVKKTAIELFGKKAWAYLVLDPQRRGREVSRLVVTESSVEELDEEVDYSIKASGIMVLVSSFDIPTDEVVPAYYVRQTAEMLFGFSKDDLDILPLRVHSEESIRGFLFLQFLTLVAFTHLRKWLGKNYSVEEALVRMRNLKCKAYDKELLVSELTKEQKEIVEATGILMSKTLGI